MNSKFSDVSNGKQNESVFNNNPSLHTGARNMHNHTVQLPPKSTCCSCRMDDSNTIIDGKAANPCTCSTLRRVRDRFVDEDANLLQQMITSTQDTIDETPYGWIEGYQKIGIEERDNIIPKIIRAQMMRYCIRKLQVIDTKLDVQALIQSLMEKEVGDKMKTVYEYFQKYKNTDCIDYLIKAYTCDSPFYSALQNRVDSFAILIYKNISALKERAFKGESYRGLSMTEKDIEAYRWAQKTNNSIIEIRTMSSTSTDLEVADVFRQPGPESKSVLCIYQFPFECQTALRLYDIPEKKLSSISHFQVENEVLLLPGTLFKVESVHQTNTNDIYEIKLVNIQVLFEDIQSALKEYDEA